MEGTIKFPSTDLFLPGIVEAAPVGVLVIAQDGRIEFVNPALQRIFGYPKDRLLGQPVEILLPAGMRGAHIDFREQYFKNPVARTMGEGRELYGLRADGHQIQIEIGLGITGLGKEARAIAFIVDVSARKRSESLFSSVVSGMPAGLVMTDQTGRIILTNKALNKMFDYPEGELKGKPIEILLPERSRHEHCAQRAGYMRDPSVRLMGEGRDLMALHRSGKEFPVEIALTPVQMSAGRAALAVVTDISKRKKLELSLRQANQNLEEFTYIASHDLRSPLRGIADLLTWIEEDVESGNITGDLKNNLNRAKMRVARAEQMIDGLLSYSRAGGRDYPKEDIDPDQLLKEVVELAVVPLGFTVEIHAALPPFRSYKTPLFTALRNLVNNALKHHGGISGRIKISACETGRFCTFTVDDDGPGVAESSREKIFRLFHRASSKSDGQGIGLAVARRMVVSHGGELTLEPNSELGGARFQILWPRFELKEER